MRGFLRRRRSTADEEWELTPANVFSGWAESEEWREWEAPRNVVAGESHHQSALRKAADLPELREGGCLKPVEVRFVREPSNRHDRNALKALVDGKHVGYLRREVAAQVAGPMDQARCREFTVCGILRGGSPGAPNIGCHVWLDHRTTPGPLLAFADDTWIVSWPPAV